METDLKTIATLAEARWAENWNFRAYLQQNVPTEVIDETVMALEGTIAPQIDCLACANCCRQISPHLTGDDILRLADGLQVPPAQMSKKYLKPDGDGEFVFKKAPCPLLKSDNCCSVYASRPEDCRSYPHLQEPDFLEFSEPTIENYGTCPIVFNVYESLKAAFAFDPSMDYISKA